MLFFLLRFCRISVVWRDGSGPLGLTVLDVEQVAMKAAQDAAVKLVDDVIGLDSQWRKSQFSQEQVGSRARWCTCLRSHFNRAAC